MDVLMPQLGETVSEGKITTWFKSVGDAVRPGDNLFEIETDKVTMEVPAISAGVVAEIRVAAGHVAPVGAIVAVISSTTSVADAWPERAQAAPASPAPPAEVRAAEAASPAGPGVETRPKPIRLDPFREVRSPERNYGPARLANGVAVTPLARRLAAQAGLALSGLKGSGPHGRIVANDVTAALALAAGKAPPPAAGASADDIKALYRPASFEEVPLDGMRRTIARRLLQSVQTIPHFHLTLDIEIDRLLELREASNASAPKDETGTPAFRLSVNDFIVKALALALRRVPAANAVWAEDRILRFKHADIGVAVALEGGLLTPVIREADLKTLAAIAAEMQDLAARARERRLKPDEYQGGATAISNLGMFGIREFTAIINPPHATILAVGAGQKRGVERNNALTFVSQMTVTLTCDHRVVDGALGAQLLAAFKDLIENPVQMLVA